MFMASGERNGRSSLLLSPIVVAVALWIVGLIVMAVAFVSGANAVRNATADTEVTFQLVFVPILVAFRHAGRIGAHLQWGSLLLLVGPFVIGFALAIVRIQRLLKEKGR